MGFSYSPKVVTDGLVLYLDAANPLSYANGSTKWNDLSRGRNNGTLVNGPTYESVKQGYFTFDGTNQQVDFASNDPNLSVGTDDFTFEMFARRNTTNTNMGVWVGHPYGTNSVAGAVWWFGGGGGLALYVYPGDGASNAKMQVAGADDTEWHHWVATCKRGSSTIGDQDVYKDGVIQSRNNNTLIQSGWDLTSTNTPGIGDWGFGDFNGDLAIFRIYRKHFTAQEVLQNYNATKSRFGL